MVDDRYERILAVLVKIEGTEGTDAVPVGAANAMQMSNVSITPIAGDEVSRELIKPYLGAQEMILTGNYVQIEGEVELAGAGAAGTLPAYGPLLRACGMREVQNVATSAVYDPLSSSHDSVSIYWIQAGVRHIALGCRGTFTISIIPKQLPRIRFSMMGLIGTITDQAMPVVDHSGFIKPVPVNKAQTTLDLHGYTSVAESLSLDLGGTVTPRFLIGEEGMKITDRKSTGTAVFKADTIGNKDWVALSKASTLGALALVHGTVAGNIVEIDAPKVQIGRPSQGATNGILNVSLPLSLIPNAGNDELVLTVK